MSCLVLSEESLIYLKRTLQDSLFWKVASEKNIRLLEQCPKWRCLTIMHSATFGESQKTYQHKHLIPKLKHAGEGLMSLGFFCSHRTWVPHSHWVDHEPLCIPKYSRLKCEAIRMTAIAWPKLGHATGQWSKHTSKSPTEWLKRSIIKNNQGVVIAQSKSKHHPAWNAEARAVHKQMPRKKTEFTL